uniref:Chemokine interleukin-8-like domain-containing protein n=1 Tax=Eptatretus burgeri TaxID=7764 RepID=A0A8C4NE77_EPTBU
MNHKYIVALALVLIMGCIFSEGNPFGVGSGCQCPSVQSHFIHPNRFHNLEIISPNSGCSKTEIIVILKSDLTNTVCLDPQANWVKRVMDKLLEQ